MSAYEELVSDCVTMLHECFGEDPEDDSYVRAILSVAFRTLETVTDEMNDEANLVWKYGSPEVWLAMLAVSPLAKPKEATE